MYPAGLANTSHFNRNYRTFVTICVLPSRSASFSNAVPYRNRAYIQVCRDYNVRLSAQALEPTSRATTYGVLFHTLLHLLDIASASSFFRMLTCRDRVSGTFITMAVL